MIQGQHPEFSMTDIMQAIQWWKTKNIWKRSLDCDDAKAYRMILKYLHNRYSLKVIDKS